MPLFSKSSAIDLGTAFRDYCAFLAAPQRTKQNFISCARAVRQTGHHLGAGAPQ